MGANLSRTNLNTAALILVAVSICGIHFSNAVSSISLFLALSISFLIILKEKRVKLSWLWLIGVFAAYQVGMEYFVHSANSSELVKKTLVKAPLIFAPLLFLISDKPKLSEKLLTVVSLFISWTAIASIMVYFKDKEFYDIMISESKPLPLFSKVYHIEYSLILSISCLGTVYHGMKNRSRFIGHAQLALAIILILALHILSTRTGLLGFYTGGFAFFLFYFNRTTLKTKVFSFVAIVALVLILYQVPSLKNRITNSKEDLMSVVNGETVNNKSFGQRWVAWGASIESIKKRPLTGYGMSHVKSTIDKNYRPEHESKIDSKNKVMPHNVYLETMVQSGVLAGLLYFLFLVIGIVHSLSKNRVLLASILCALLAASMFESITERQAGIIALIGFISLAKSSKTVEQKG